MKQPTNGPETGAESREPILVQSVGRALDLLEAFAATPRPLSLAELARASGMTKSSAQRLAQTLAARGYLERVDGGLLPGRRLLDRSFDYLRCNGFIERATPVMMELRRNIGERVDLSLFDDLTMMFVVRLQSKRETFYATLVGRRVPTFCSSGGRAVMAALPDERVEDILARSDRHARTPRTVSDIAGNREKVREARNAGFAIAVAELLPGEVSIGAAVLDGARAPIAAIHVAGSLGEWSVDDFAGRYSPLIIEAARALSG